MSFKVRDKHESHVSNMDLNDRMDAVMNGHSTTQSDERYNFSSSCDAEETDQVEPGSSNESVTDETQANLFNNIKGEVVKFRDKQDSHVKNVDLNDGMDAVMNCQLATQQDKKNTFSSTCDEDGSGKVDPGSSNESITNGNYANFFKDINEEVQAFIKPRDKQEPQVTRMELNDEMGAVMNSQLATQQDKENETGKVDPGSSVTIETHASLLKDINGEVETFVSTSSPEDVMVCQEVPCVFIFFNLLFLATSHFFMILWGFSQKL